MLSVIPLSKQRETRISLNFPKGILITILLNFFPLSLNRLRFSMEISASNRKARSVISLDHLTNISVNKVALSCFKPSQGTQIIGTLHPATAIHYLLSFNPDAKSEVILIENLVVWRKNSDRNSFGIEVNPEDILLLRQFNFIFRQDTQQSEGQESDHKSCKPIHYPKGIHTFGSYGS